MEGADVLTGRNHVCVVEIDHAAVFLRRDDVFVGIDRQREEFAEDVAVLVGFETEDLTVDIEHLELGPPLLQDGDVLLFLLAGVGDDLLVLFIPAHDRPETGNHLFECVHADIVEQFSAFHTSAPSYNSSNLTSTFMQNRYFYQFTTNCGKSHNFLFFPQRIIPLQSVGIILQKRGCASRWVCLARKRPKNRRLRLQTGRHRPLRPGHRNRRPQSKRHRRPSHRRRQCRHPQRRRVLR